MRKKTDTKSKGSEVELRKLKRLELLEMMLEQGKEIERLRNRVQELEEQAEDKTILLNEAGNIASASLAMNHVMEQTQAAAEQYLTNVKKLCRRMERETAEKCRAMEQQTQKKCMELEQKAMERFGVADSRNK